MSFRGNLLFRCVVIVLCLVCMGLRSHAEQPSPRAFASGADNFVSELIACHHLFKIAAETLNRRMGGKSDEGQRAIAGYRVVGVRLLNLAFALAREIKMTKARLLARSAEIVKDMSDETLINSPEDSYAVLALQYRKLCLSISKNPYDRLAALVANERRRIR